MKYANASLGRVLVVRLEDGDVVHECLEELAKAEGIERAAVLFLGGADDASHIVVGPEDGRAATIVPMELALSGAHEAAGVGTIFPNEQGEPVLHMHAAFGRGESVRAGCIRAGVKTWIVAEAVIIELTDSQAMRRLESSGFTLLQVSTGD